MPKLKRPKRATSDDDVLDMWETLVEDWDTRHIGDASDGARFEAVHGGEPTDLVLQGYRRLAEAVIDDFVKQFRRAEGKEKESCWNSVLLGGMDIWLDHFNIAPEAFERGLRAIERKQMQAAA